MRKKSIIIIALVAVCLQSCIVKSIHPFFKEKDVVYNKSLEGDWTDQDKNGWRIHQNPFKPNSYGIALFEEGERGSLAGTSFHDRR
ncbi:MAG: hypothetical protein WDO15_27945 [Bacteroidota bacterium]